MDCPQATKAIQCHPEEQRADHSTGGASSALFGIFPCVAVQQGLGVLSQRRTRARDGDSCGLAAARAYLNKLSGSRLSPDSGLRERLEPAPHCGVGAFVASASLFIASPSLNV
jgi:hypothetical protein